MEANYFIVLCWFLPYSNMHQLQVYMCPPSSVPPPPSPSCPRLAQSTSFGCPASCIKPTLVLCFTYGNLQVSALFSQSIPPSPSPTESKSLFYTAVSLFLFCIYGYHYHLSKFHIYVLVYCNGLYLSGLLHSVGLLMTFIFRKATIQTVDAF